MDVFPQRGEIWQVTFEPTVGAEITKTRPALVVSASEAGRLPLRIVVPITDWKPVFDHFFWFIHLLPSQENGLSKESGADCFQVKSLSTQRFVRKVGILTDEYLDEVVCAIALCIGYKHDQQHLEKDTPDKEDIPSQPFGQPTAEFPNEDEPEE